MLEVMVSCKASILRSTRHNFGEVVKSVPQKLAKARKATLSIHLTCYNVTSFQLTCDLSFFPVFWPHNGAKAPSKRTKTLASKAKSAFGKSRRMANSSQVTSQPNRSSSPIDIDKDTGEESVQKAEEEHTDIEYVDLGDNEKTTIQD